MTRSFVLRKIRTAERERNRDRQFKIAYDAFVLAINKGDHHLEMKARRIMEHGNDRAKNQ